MAKLCVMYGRNGVTVSAFEGVFISPFGCCDFRLFTIGALTKVVGSDL